MKNLRIIAVFCCTLAVLTLSLNEVWAALPIDLEIITEPGAPLSAPQEWARLLGRMNLGSVRIRGVRSGERPQLKEKKLGNTTRYHLLVVLNRRNELVLPERRFRIRNRKALQKYFEQLPAKAAYHAEDRGSFGLTEKQFRQVFAELSQPVGFSTVAKSASEVLTRLEKTLTVRVVRSKKGARLSGKPLTVELQNFSAGTVLAYVLRREGLVLRPEQLPGMPLRLSIAPYDSKRESWPVGWKPAVSSRHSAPQLYELRNIEINNLTLAQALTALQPPLKIPVLLDDWIFRRHKIDPSKIQVSHLKKRTFLKSAVGKLLSQARLAEEVRVDEQEQPFLWVTRFGKDSPTLSMQNAK